MNLEELNNKIKELENKNKELEKENKLFKKEIHNLEKEIVELNDLIKKSNYNYYKQSLYGFDTLWTLIRSYWSIRSIKKDFLINCFYNWINYIKTYNKHIYFKLNIIYNIDEDKDEYDEDDEININNKIKNKFISVFLRKLYEYYILDDILKTEENIKNFLLKFDSRLELLHFMGESPSEEIQFEIFDYLIEFINLNEVFENINNNMLECINNIINKN